MKRIALFKSPEVPENITDSIPRGFDLQELDLSERENLQVDNQMFCILCGWEFFEKNKKFLNDFDIPEESVVVLYSPEHTDEIKYNRLIYQFVREDGVDIITGTFRNLYKSFIRNSNYEKEKSLNRELLSIGIALSAERDNDKLLTDILRKIRKITRADAGSLYLLVGKKDIEEQSLLFKIAQNDSNPSDFSEFRMTLNTKSIAGYVAVTSEILNIPDVYSIPDHEHYSFNKSYDQATNYRTCSVLTVPMLDHHENTIGVIQLINKKRFADKKLESPEDVDRYVEPFDNEDENIVLALASQAAVSLENNILYSEIEALFEGLVAASVKAIESRDPTTSGHSSRVAEYSVKTAAAIDRQKQGVFKDVNFSEANIKELRYAGLLHDFGKVGVREAVLVKSKKLYPGQIETIKQRFDYIKKSIELECLKSGESFSDNPEVKELEEAFELISASNQPALFSEETADKLKLYNKKYYKTPEGDECKWLNDDEYEYLSIKKGSLTESEREEIESHVKHSYDFLKNIPWTESLKKLPEIAKGHHECPDGSGYPDGLTDEELSLQSRIMAVADIYDALTANDRPYKKAIQPEKALMILESEMNNGHLDKDVVKLFIENEIYKTGDNL